ncbi:hypothetical protein C8R44DRAFT_987270 [Mycena epipterygia]|nr:hypothetical protein C8R44DRAFT_987270 [Mycena epipterygia]
MDCVASSQPSQDEDLCTVDFVGTSQPFEDEVDLLPSVPPPADVVTTCQPFKDTEEDLQASTTPPPPTLVSSTPSHQSLYFDSDSNTPARRSRLIRRASPVKASPTPFLARHPIPRPLNLVRRVTAPNKWAIRAAEMRRKRQCAREKAHHIIKRIRALARLTARLKRKHRELCAFVLDPVHL